MAEERVRRRIENNEEEPAAKTKPKKKLSPKAKKRAAQAAKKQAKLDKKQAKLDKKAARLAAKKSKAGKKAKKPKKGKKSKKGEKVSEDGRAERKAKTAKVEQRPADRQAAERPKKPKAEERPAKAKPEEKSKKGKKGKKGEEGGKGGKKKKGKLPMIAAIVVVLGAGGFFGLKMASGPAEEPEVALGEMMALGEFIVNLSEGKYYLQAEITLHLMEGYGEGGGGGHGGGDEGPDGLSPVRDAIITVMSSATLDEVMTTAGKEQLKRDLAEAINKAMLATSHDESDKPHKEAESDGEEEEPKHPDWHSQEGPVLMVYFDKFAVQPMRRY